MENEIEIKEYRLSDGEFLKVTDQDGKEMFYQLNSIGVLATNQKVDILTKEEYIKQSGKEVVERPKMVIPEHMKIDFGTESDTQSTE